MAHFESAYLADRHAARLALATANSCQDPNRRETVGAVVRGSRSVHGTAQFQCTCCGLHQEAQHGDDRATLCVRCRQHSANTFDDLAAREADHAAMYHRALFDAQDEVLLAQDERDYYRGKMHAAYGSRELLVQVLAGVERMHHVRGKRCICGRRACPIAALLADPRVARLVRTYDEVHRTMRELRAANPDAWVDKWDYIDVSLVYPERRRHSSRGRHRATG